MLQSLIIAFSTYSKIPMPRVEWDEKNMKYSMCWFPVVGAFIGLLSLCCFHIVTVCSVGTVLSAVILTLLPLLITGGIHMDGFMDTVDAMSSYRSMEERLRILKDPHAGAFAILYAILYILLMFGLFTEIRQEQIVFVAVGYIYSRILSGLSVVTFRKAKRDGMLAATADASDRKVKWILLVELLFCIAGLMILGICERSSGGIAYALACAVAGMLSFCYYRYMAYKWFGGTTGDLAGYFLQICEMAILLFIVAVGYWIT